MARTAKTILMAIGALAILAVAAGATAETAQNLGAAWAVNCTDSDTGLDCRIVQTLLLKDTRQLLVSIVVRVPPGGKESAMMVHLPFGLFLPAGVTVRVDDRAGRTVPIQTCDKDGCYAGIPLTPDGIGELQKGTRLLIAFQNLAKKTITVSVSLIGFSSAYAKVVK